LKDKSQVVSGLRSDEKGLNVWI